MVDGQMAADEAALRRDLENPAFQIGVRKKKWRLVRIAFPYTYFEIAAGPREVGPSCFLLRTDCAGYGATAPTSALWDAREDRPLADPLRPKTAQGATVIAFTSGCGDCLYHPIDQVARLHWGPEFDEMAWGDDSTITTLLEIVHALVHQSDYHHSTAPEAAAHMPLDPVGLAAE